VLFQVDDVRVVRGGRVVLENFSADLAEGSSCVFGPSGAGKSTLLRLLNRLADPDAGRIVFQGEDVRTYDPQALRREVCLVPQLPALVEGTVADNLRFAISFGGPEEADPAELLPLAGLDPAYAERDSSQLSVGEQQRVMLARALALRPKVLLLDEPTSALDSEARDVVESALWTLRERSGISLVLVTHDRDQAERLSDHVVEMAP
jgi:putative ABC transport system ATP-binding protein